MTQTLALDIDPITDYGVVLDLVKTDLRISHSDLDDLLITELIPAAVERAEAFTRRSMIARTHRWIVDELPYGCEPELILPRGKVQSVTSVAVSVNHAITTLRGPTSGSPIGTDYQEDLRGDRGRLRPKIGNSWPVADYDVPSPIVVTFSAGWTTATLPALLRRGFVEAVRGFLDGDGSEVDLEIPEKLLSAYRLA